MAIPGKPTCEQYNGKPTHARKIDLPMCADARDCSFKCHFDYNNEHISLSLIVCTWEFRIEKP